MNAWVVRSGAKGNDYSERFWDSSAVAIGYGVGDLSGVGTLYEIKAKLSDENPDWTANQLGARAGRFFSFIERIREGDFILTPPAGKDDVLVGYCRGPYEYSAATVSEDMPHVRKVDWIRRAPKSNFSEQFLQSISTKTVVWDASKYVGEIEALLTQDADDSIARWGAFVGWAKLFYEWEEFYERERGYKLEVGKTLSAVKQSLRDGNPDWHDLLKTTFRDAHSYLTHWRANDALLKLDPPRIEEALRRIWGLSSPDSLQERVSGFQKFGPFSTPGVMASILLAGDDATRYPMYRHTPLRDAFRLTGYPSEPNNSLDAWERYEHALGFWDEFIKQSSYRSLEIQDRLDAQALVWCVTQYGTEDMPEDWAEDIKDDLIVYRAGKGTQVTFPPSPGPARTPVLQTLWSHANVDALAEKLLWEPQSKLREIVDDLQEKRQVIFYGPPGTGKTYVAREIAKQCQLDSGDFEIVQFHPSYSYEDFVEGFRPARTANGQPGFELVQGPLRRIADKARDNREANYILVIDELNRGNVAKVFGELYFLLEYRDEEVRLQYGGGAGFSLPSNLWFICTMNTADRSIALMDAALRRRFYFAPFFPDEPPIEGLLNRWLEREGQDTLAARLVDEANKSLDRDARIGPSYFMRRGQTLDENSVRRIWDRAVMPYVEEQCFGDDAKLNTFKFNALKRRLGSTEPGEDVTTGENAEEQGNDANLAVE